MEQIIESYKKLIAELQELYTKKQNNTGNTGIEILNRMLIDKRVSQIDIELDELREREIASKDKYPHCLNEISDTESDKKFELDKKFKSNKRAK